MPTDEDRQPSSFARTFTRVKNWLVSLPHLIGNEIWETDKVQDKSLRGSGFALLRTLSITWDGILRNQIPSQAGALSYYTLIAIGPLLAIVIMVSGFVLKGDDSEDVIVDNLTKLIYFVAPPTEQAAVIGLDNSTYDNGNEHGPTKSAPDTDPIKNFSSTSATTSPHHIAAHAAASTAATNGALRPSPSESPSADNDNDGIPNSIDKVSQPRPDQAASVDPRIVDFLQGIVRNARSGSLGVFGSLMLIWLSVQLLSTIEKTFNQIWGVRQGRNLLQRIVFYWTLISLGTLLGFTSISIGVYGQIAQQFENFPLGHVFKDSFLWLIPLWTFISILGLLAIFNRFIPNTHVRWKPALLGALAVALLLNLSKSLSFLYVGFVSRQGSLLGVVSILPIFLFGLWLFWVILLLGGQLTFAIQNVNNLTNQRAWENVSLRTRETLSLVALLMVARRFDNCKQPYTADDLADKVRVPGNILNECLSQLVDIGYLSPVENDADTNGESCRYQPARPLERITLADFKQSLETRGNNEGMDLIKYSDPVLNQYEEQLLDYSTNAVGNKSLKELFAPA